MECPFCQHPTSAYSRQCNSCGRPIPPGQYLLEESGLIEASPTATSETGTREAGRLPGRYRFARLGDRFLAFVLDLVFLCGPFAALDAWIFTRWGKVEGMELQLSVLSVLAAIGVNATLLFLYGWILEGAWGITLGKVLVGIRVVGAARRTSFSACAVRNALRVVDGLGFYLFGALVAACSAVRQRVGDIYAGTAVIEEAFGKRFQVAAIVLWISSLAATGWAVPRICASNHFAHPAFLSDVLLQVGRTEDSAYVQVRGLAVRIQLAPRVR